MPRQSRIIVTSVALGTGALAASATVSWPATAVAVGPGDTSALTGVSFKLKHTPVAAAALREVDALAANPARGVTRVSLASAAAGAANGLTWKAGCGANNAVKAVDAKVRLGGWCFANGDRSTPYWIPQGVAISRTSQLDGVVLSWYHRKKVNNEWVTDQSRVTVGPRPLVEKKGTYQPVTLAIPTATAAGKLVVTDVRPAHREVSVRGVAEATQHQGGVSLVGNYLYTADTSGGLRAFDLRRTYRVATGKNVLGVGADGKFYAHNEKYVLFQTARYVYDISASGKCPVWEAPPQARNKNLCFSTVSYEPTSKSLLTTEFKVSGGVTTSRPIRVVRWPLNTDGTLQAGAGGVVTSRVVFGSPTKAVQGVAGFRSGRGDTIYYNASNGGSPGAIYSDRDGDGRPPFKLVGPIGGESLAYDPYSGGDRIWGVTERPNQRMLYWIYRKDMQSRGMD